VKFYQEVVIKTSIPRIQDMVAELSAHLDSYSADLKRGKELADPDLVRSLLELALYLSSSRPDRFHLRHYVGGAGVGGFPFSNGNDSKPASVHPKLRVVHR
jgi:hypothetical protein